MAHVSTDSNAVLEPQPGQSLTVRTAVKDQYPTEPHSYIYCEVLDVGSAVVEGGEATFTTTGEHLVGVSLAATLPAPGTQCLACAVDGRWVLS